jgi:tetratricopeptide (TPR) repeat protein
MNGRIVGATLMVLAAAAAAHADERTVAREHYLKGTKAFDLGFYEDAIREYMEAYRAKDDPALLYNIAQANRLAGHAQEAVRFYRIYLAKQPAGSERADVETKIAELQKAVELQRKTQSQMPPDQVIRPADGTATRAEPAQAQPASARPVSAAAASSPHPRLAGRLKIGGVAAAGSGVGLIAVGIGMAVLAQQAADSYARSPTFDAGLLDNFHTYRALEGVFVGVGAAAVVGGAVAFGVGWHRSRSPRLSLMPLSHREGVQ